MNLRQDSKKSKKQRESTTGSFSLESAVATLDIIADLFWKPKPLENLDIILAKIRSEYLLINRRLETQVETDILAELSTALESYVGSNKKTEEAKETNNMREIHSEISDEETIETVDEALKKWHVPMDSGSSCSAKTDWKKAEQKNPDFADMIADPEDVAGEESETLSDAYFYDNPFDDQLYFQGFGDCLYNKPKRGRTGEASVGESWDIEGMLETADSSFVSYRQFLDSVQFPYLDAAAPRAQSWSILPKREFLENQYDELLKNIDSDGIRSIWSGKRRGSGHKGDDDDGRRQPHDNGCQSDDKALRCDSNKCNANYLYLPSLPPTPSSSLNVSEPVKTKYQIMVDKFVDTTKDRLGAACVVTPACTQSAFRDLVYPRNPAAAAERATSIDLPCQEVYSSQDEMPADHQSMEILQVNGQKKATEKKDATQIQVVPSPNSPMYAVDTTGTSHFYNFWIGTKSFSSPVPYPKAVYSCSMTTHPKQSSAQLIDKQSASADTGSLFSLSSANREELDQRGSTKPHQPQPAAPSEHTQSSATNPPTHPMDSLIYRPTLQAIREEQFHQLSSSTTANDAAGAKSTPVLLAPNDQSRVPVADSSAASNHFVYFGPIFHVDGKQPCQSTEPAATNGQSAVHFASME